MQLIFSRAPAVQCQVNLLPSAETISTGPILKKVLDFHPESFYTI
jgi:hypothetical protein